MVNLGGIMEDKIIFDIENLKFEGKVIKTYFELDWKQVLKKRTYFKINFVDKTKRKIYNENEVIKNDKRQ